MKMTEEDYLKARLTAMAMDIDLFKRDDIYTLFITTRIVNFLRGLELPESTDLCTLLDHPWENDRVITGCMQLKELLLTGTLHFRTSHGKVENDKFRKELFFRVLQEAKIIMCQNGKQIRIAL